MNCTTPIKLLWEKGESTRTASKIYQRETTTSLCVVVRPRREKSRKLSDSSKKKKSNGVFVTKMVCLS